MLRLVSLVALAFACVARADEPGSGECPARALIEWPRWPLASLASATRDYFRVEDKAGLRFWLFRAGLYRELKQPHWFLHGMYA
jgi:protein ImuB